MRLNDSLKKWILMTGYLFCVILLALIHEPWLDELHAWVMARDMSIPELWSAMKVEGHFCLWFWILMPFAKAGLGVYWLQIISIAFMLIAAWLLVFKTDFSLLAKVAILLSFPMVYQFPVISRCYALIPPILFGIALCYKDLDKNKWLFAILVGLLSHTHVYMEGTVLALFLVYTYEMILPKCRERNLNLYDFYPLIVIVLFVILAFVQVIRNPFSPVYVYLGNAAVEWHIHTKGLATTVDYILKGYSILPYGYFDSGTNGIVAHCLAFIPMLFLIWAVFNCFDWKSRFVIALSLGWQLLFSIFIYFIGHQRVYLPFFIVLMLFIMMGRYNKRINYLIICLSFLSSVTGYSRYIFNDISKPFSSYESLAKAIEDNVPTNDPVYSIDLGGDAVSAYFQKSSIHIIPTPLDSIKRDTFYVVSNRPFFNDFEVKMIYDDSHCFEDKHSLFKLIRPNANH